mgnify:CR=1 FL=1
MKKFIRDLKEKEHAQTVFLVNEKNTGVDRNGDEVVIEGNGFFARMLQHETGHLDGFLYVDVLIGRNARAAKKAIKKSGWGTPGLSWTPGTVADPFGHDD